jgi:hypothetical protein
MRNSQSFLTGRRLVARPSANLWLAWADAADDAQEAYLAWDDADRTEQAGAFVVYRAALDREEAAARALQLQSRG